MEAGVVGGRLYSSWTEGNRGSTITNHYNQTTEAQRHRED